jgi:DNA-binding Lrp family transcriptional regulator
VVRSEIGVGRCGLELDRIDRTILSELCNNCRITYESLAKKTKLSANAVKNRVHHLIESGGSPDDRWD